MTGGVHRAECWLRKATRERCSCSREDLQWKEREDQQVDEGQEMGLRMGIAAQQGQLWQRGGHFEYAIIL